MYLLSGADDFRFEDPTTNIIVLHTAEMPTVNRIGFRGDDVAQELSESFRLGLVLSFGAQLPAALQAENTFFADNIVLTILDQTGISNYFWTNM